MIIPPRDESTFLHVSHVCEGQIKLVGLEGSLNWNDSVKSCAWMHARW